MAPHRSICENGAKRRDLRCVSRPQPASRVPGAKHVSNTLEKTNSHPFHVYDGCPQAINPPGAGRTLELWSKRLVHAGALAVLLVNNGEPNTNVRFGTQDLGLTGQYTFQNGATNLDWRCVGCASTRRSWV